MSANEVDLIPGDFRKYLSMRRLLSNFFIVFVGVLCLIATARITLAYLSQQDAVQLGRLEQQNQTLQQSKTKTEGFQQKKRVIEQQINALDQLRGHDRLAFFLNAIDSAYNQGIWLDRVHFMRRPGSDKTGSANASKVVAKGADTQTGLDLTQGAEIVGHAINHTVLAEFMQRLAAQPGVADLRLVSTDTRSYTSVKVVDFNLTLQVNEKAQGKP